MPVCCLPGHGSILHPDEDHRCANVERVKEIVRWARRFGSPQVASETGTCDPLSVWMRDPRTVLQDGVDPCAAAIMDLSQTICGQGAVVCPDTCVNSVAGSVEDRNIASIDGVIDQSFDTPGNTVKIAQAKDAARSVDASKTPADIGDTHARASHTFPGIGKIVLDAPGIGVLNCDRYMQRLAQQHPIIIEQRSEDNVPRTAPFLKDKMRANGLRGAGEGDGQGMTELYGRPRSRGQITARRAAYSSSAACGCWTSTPDRGCGSPSWWTAPSTWPRSNTTAAQSAGVRPPGSATRPISTTRARTALARCGRSPASSSLAGSTICWAATRFPPPTTPRRRTVRHGLHGRLAGTPARLTGYGERWDGYSCILWAEATVIQAAMFGEVQHLHRRIEADLGGNEIRLTDRVVNKGATAAPHMLLYHVNIGHPVLDDGSRYLARIRQVLWAAHADRCRHQGTGYRTMRALRDRFAEQVWQHDMAPDSAGEVPVALVNDGLAFGIEVMARRDQLPCAYQWQNLQSRQYVLGIEPSTHHVLGDAAARDRAEMIWLSADEARDYDLRCRVLDGPGAIAATEARIRAAALQTDDEYPPPTGVFPPLTGPGRR